MIDLKIPNSIFRGHIHELNEFFVQLARVNTRYLDLTIVIEKTHSPQGIEWHGDWYKILVNEKEFIVHSDEFYGMDVKAILNYINQL